MKKKPTAAAKTKRPVKRRAAKRVARSVSRMTHAAATRALADLHAAIAALPPGRKDGNARMRQVFGLATKLNHLVKRMKSALVI